MNIKQQWIEADSQYIRKKIVEYNMEKLPDEVKTANEKISFVVKNDEGELVAGITGHSFWHHLHIDFLWVDKALRGQGYGSKLLREMEDYAKEKGCYLIYLDSFSFQAPEFYKKHGYKVFGKLENHPKGFDQYFLEKRL